ncbi:hypothetical protein T190607A02C_20302 [Tenacibaculum sp. 190524A02b]
MIKKYLVRFLIILTITYLGNFLYNMFLFAEGVEKDAQKLHTYTNNEVIVFDSIGKTYTNVNLTHWLGTYKYTYEYNTYDFKEDHYLVIKPKEIYYYGTSDDFDQAREAYLPGFFKTKVNTFKITKDSLYFSITVDNSFFYKEPIIPNTTSYKKTNWNEQIMSTRRDYKGIIKKDTILINTKGFITRAFIKTQPNEN